MKRFLRDEVLHPDMPLVEFFLLHSIKAKEVTERANKKQKRDLRQDLRTSR